MNFQTTRQKSVKESIEELRERSTTMKTNRKALMESTANELDKKHNAVMLEALKLENETTSQNSAVLENMKQKRSRELLTRKTTIDRMGLLESAKEMTMNKVLFEIVYEAYWLDDSVKQSTIKETYNAYKDTLSVVDNVCLESKVQNGNKSKFIKAVESVVEQVCEKAVSRILLEAKESGDTDIKFNFTAEEESELDEKLSELGKDDIVEMVKNKVLSVVQDEKRAGKEKAEMLKEIEDSTNEDVEDVDTEDPTGVGDTTNADGSEESQKKLTEGVSEELNSADSRLMPLISAKFKDSDEVRSLLTTCKCESPEGLCTFYSTFNEDSPSVILSSLKEYESLLQRDRVNVMIQKDVSLESKNEVRRAIDECLIECRQLIHNSEKSIKNKSYNQKNEVSEVLEAMKLDSKRRTLNNSAGSTLFDSFMIANVNKVRTEAVTEGTNLPTDQVMNAALIETVLQYTVLETLNTLKLYNFKSLDINKIKAYNKQSLHK